MAKAENAQDATIPAQEISKDSYKEIIYADRVINAGFGPMTTKLTLAMESSAGQFTAISTLVLPTPALLELAGAIQSMVENNEELRQGMLSSLDKYREQLVKAGNS